ncbi:MAG: hypothetical protein KJ999_21725 [Gammaproteobacteria bacterium]|nr:hypothetical protein [Gammaproteobacteria bacterium]
MRVLESTPFIHTDGVIHVELDNTKNPVFFIGQHFHDAITAAGGEQKLEPHPAHERLKRGRDSLQSIPVRVMFDDARTNLMARYEAWGDNPSQGPQCIGDGECAKVYNHETQAWVATPCRGPALCPIPSNYNLNCALRSKVLLTVVDDGQELGTFEFRSSAENTFRSMLGNLQVLQATHGTLRDLPLNLTGWVKSTQGSSYQPFSCATLERGAGVAQVTAHEVNEVWELLGKHTQDMWMSECIPTDWEMKPLQLPPPKATKPAPRAKAVGDTESLFAHALERMKENHEQRPPF